MALLLCVITGFTSDVLLMLTVAFGAVTVVLLILLIGQCIRKQQRDDSKTKLKEENEGLMSRDGPLLSSNMSEKAGVMDPYVLCYYTTVE
ncbi:hypothetical protein AOLI_G00274700 [Acnodon oligacanthus]